MSNLKAKKKTNTLTRPVEKISANDFYKQVVDDLSKFVSFKINEELSDLKKEMHDKDILIKILRNKIISQNDEIKSLGAAICQLGICEVTLLNDFKNKIKDSISVVSSNGQVVGHVESLIYGVVFQNKEESKEGGNNT